MQPSTTDELRALIRRGLLAEADPAYLKRIASLVPTDAPVMGVRVPKIRQRMKAFRAANPNLTLPKCIALLDLAFKDQVREEVLFGIFLIAKYQREFKPGLWPKIDHWVGKIDNWESCDQLAINVAAVMVARHPLLVDDLVAWASSPQLWRRRFAIATGTTLNQKGRAFPEQALRICAEAMTDKEPMVQKALCWALREVSRHSPDMVFGFLCQWKPKISRRLLRESTTKLGEAQRADLMA